MLIAWVKNLMRPAVEPPSVPAPPQSVRPADGKPLHYPPSDPGLPVLTAEEVVASAQDMVDRLRTHAATGEQAFSQRFLQPITRLADYISVIPATASGLFSGEMGLFRACVETAFYSFQASDGRIFLGRAGVEKRHAMEGRWRYLCFCAGLMYPLGRSLETVVVTDSRGRSWQRHFGGITGWARQSGADRLFATWPAAAEDAIGPSNAALSILNAVIGAENLQFLQDGDAELVTCLLSLVAGQTASPNASDVVSGAWNKIQRREAGRRPQAFGRVVAGTHIGPYLVGAIRALVATGAWKINDSPLRADTEGLYLVWPAAAAPIIEHGRRAGLQGWPTEPQTLAQLLAAAGITEPSPGDAGFVELIDGEGEIQQALKIANPLSVLEEFEPEHYRVPQTVEALAARDPLAGAKADGAGAASEEKVPVPQPMTPAAAPAQPALVSPPPPTTAQPGGSAAPPPPVPSPSSAPSEPPAARLQEGAEVDYADLVPPELRRSIGDALAVEVLGKLVHLWKGGTQGAVMRRTDIGLCVAYASLKQVVRDPPKWLGAMSKAGLLYVPPGRDGAKVQDIQLADGKKVDGIVLSRLACSKLGI